MSEVLDAKAKYHIEQNLHHLLIDVERVCRILWYYDIVENSQFVFAVLNFILCQIMHSTLHGG
jgi:hypothetical protein